MLLSVWLLYRLVPPQRIVGLIGSDAGLEINIFVATVIADNKEDKARIAC